MVIPNARASKTIFLGEGYYVSQILDGYFSNVLLSIVRHFFIKYPPYPNKLKNVVNRLKRAR